MKIGIDIRTASGQKAGKGWYTFHLVRELLALDHKNEYILYTNKITGDLAGIFGVSSRVSVKVIDRHPFLWHFSVIKDFARQHGELFFAPTSYIIPAFLPKKIRSVVTAHDLVSFLHPQMHQTKATVLEHLFFRMALRKTSRVLVPSENTKRDLMDLFRYPAAQISVTPLGVNERVYGIQKPVFGIEKYNLPKDFILAVSGLEPRKNIGTLLETFLEIKKKHPKLTLVVVGGVGWKSQKLQEKIHAAGPAVEHIQNVSAEDLPAFYHKAKVFVFPSLYEGFGLPPLEAMASGCPVICSNASSLPEVCGDAALLFDPRDKKTLEAHIEKILTDPWLRETLIARGKKRAAEFSWKKTAEKTLDVIASAAKQSRLLRPTASQ